MSDRYVPNTGVIGAQFGPADAKKIMLAAGAALKEVKLNAKDHSGVSGGSIYVGTGGISMAYLHLARQVQRGARFPASAYLKKHTLEHSLNLAWSFASDAESILPERKRVTFLEGYSGVLALHAVLHSLMGWSADSARCIKRLEAYYQEAVEATLEPDECELMYGRAGYLYSLLWVQEQLGPGTINQTIIKTVMLKLLEAGQAGAEQLAHELESAPKTAGFTLPKNFGLMYTWHGKNYLGAAHGLVGILYVLLHCFKLLRDVDPSGTWYRAIQSSLDALVLSLLPSGNLPSSLGKNSDALVQWCHGAAGLIPLLVKAHEVMTGDGRYLVAAKRAADAVWQRGLLTKGVGLCHGISGNGYAFLSLYRATGDATYLGCAQQFAKYGVEHWQELYHNPDRPASLYEGLAGAVCFWLDVLQPDHSCWPGYEL